MNNSFYYIESSKIANKECKMPEDNSNKDNVTKNKIDSIEGKNKN